MTDPLKAAIFILITGYGVTFAYALDEIHQDLHQIAINTTQPVQIGVAGITPEAAQVFEDAMRPAKKGKAK